MEKIKKLKDNINEIELNNNNSNSNNNDICLIVQKKECCHTINLVHFILPLLKNEGIKKEMVAIDFIFHVLEDQEKKNRDHITALLLRSNLINDDICQSDHV